jgi:hypothetical protein
VPAHAGKDLQAKGVRPKPDHDQQGGCLTLSNNLAHTQAAFIHLPPLDRPHCSPTPQSSTATWRYPQPATDRPPPGHRFGFSPLQPTLPQEAPFSDDGSHPSLPPRALQDQSKNVHKPSTQRCRRQARNHFTHLHQTVPVPVPRVGQAQQSLQVQMTQASRAPESWNQAPLSRSLPPGMPKRQEEAPSPRWHVLLSFPRRPMARETAFPEKVDLTLLFTLRGPRLIFANGLHSAYYYHQHLALYINHHPA